MSVQVSTQTVEEMVEAMFPNRRGTNLARHAVRFIIESVSVRGDANIDINTLRNFVEYLVGSKNYN